VLVASVKALKHHGGDIEGGLAEIEVGAANLARHIGIIKGFGLEAVVGVNRFPTDTEEELEAIRTLALEHGAYAAELNEAFQKGGDGATALAEAVVSAAEQPNAFEFAYPIDAPIEEKIRAIATKVYGAEGVELLPAAQQAAARFEEAGLGTLPICMAKTHLSLSHDPVLRNAPTGFTVPVRDLRPYTGAGWIVALCGDMMTMPGLGKVPAAHAIDIDASGETVGLF
jgi:formyltetrahydrofolate synthetase